MSTQVKSVPRFLAHYRDTVVSEIMKKFKFKNVFQVPKIEKIVVNMGIKQGAVDKGVVEAAAQELALLAGQRPVITRAKKSIAGFKLREGQPLGCKVTLRGRIMYEFLERLIGIAIPRVRDFRGLSAKSFDGNGNYTFGLTEHIVFPELELDKVKQVRGMDITINTTATNDEVAKELLSLMGFPFVK